MSFMENLDEHQINTIMMAIRHHRFGMNSMDNYFPLLFEQIYSTRKWESFDYI